MKMRIVFLAMFGTIAAIVGCGSDSNTARSDAGQDSAPGIDASAIKCLSKNDCSGADICCSETDKFGTLCQAAPCGKTLLGYPVQLCASTAECIHAGEVCAPFTVAGVTINTCQAPGGGPDAGSDSDGG